MSLSQVQLDRYTGTYALNLRAASISMEESYSRVEDYRKATLAACAIVTTCPEAMELFRVAATAEAGIEEMVKTYWNLQMSSWISLPLDRSKFPEFPYEIVNPNLSFDELQSTPFLLQSPSPIQLTLTKKNLKSTAELKRNQSHDWDARWTE